MPKKRKTRKQKIQANMRPSTLEKTDTPLVQQETQSIKISEKFSLTHKPGVYNTNISTSHAYLIPELRKTALLSAGIIIAEILLFFLLRNHIIVLSSLPY
jgi:hypothetical protein